MFLVSKRKIESGQSTMMLIEHERATVLPEQPEHIQTRVNNEQ